MLMCKDIHQKASDYHDGNMSFGQRASFKLHLMMCVHCRRYLLQFKLMVSSLAGMKTQVHDEKELHQLVQLIKSDEGENNGT